MDRLFSNYVLHRHCRFTIGFSYHETGIINGIIKIVCVFVKCPEYHYFNTLKFFADLVPYELKFFKN